MLVLVGSVFVGPTRTSLGRVPVLTIAVAQDRTHLDKGYSPTDVLGWSPATDVLDVLYHVV